VHKLPNFLPLEERRDVENCLILVEPMLIYRVGREGGGLQEKIPNLLKNLPKPIVNLSTT
jgi:hypothetical protein